MRFPDLRLCRCAAENERTRPTQLINDYPAERELRFLIPAGVVILCGRARRKQPADFCEIDLALQRC